MSEKRRRGELPHEAKRQLLGADEELRQRVEALCASLDAASLQELGELAQQQGLLGAVRGRAELCRALLAALRPRAAPLALLFDYYSQVNATLRDAALARAQRQSPQ